MKARINCDYQVMHASGKWACTCKEAMRDWGLDENDVNVLQMCLRECGIPCRGRKKEARND